MLFCADGGTDVLFADGGTDVVLCCLSRHLLKLSPFPTRGQ